MGPWRGRVGHADWKEGRADKGGYTGNSRQISLATVASFGVPEVEREPVPPKIFRSEISV